MRRFKYSWPVKPIIITLIIIPILGFFIMVLWNLILPDLLGFKNISYLQALGLFILIRILMGSLGTRSWAGLRGFGGKRGFLHSHWNSMTGEEKKAWMEKRFNES